MIVPDLDPVSRRGADSARLKHEQLQCFTVTAQLREACLQIIDDWRGRGHVTLHGSGRQVKNVLAAGSCRHEVAAHIIISQLVCDGAILVATGDGVPGSAGGRTALQAPETKLLHEPKIVP